MELRRHLFLSTDLDYRPDITRLTDERVTYVTRRDGTQTTIRDKSRIAASGKNDVARDLGYEWTGTTIFSPMLAITSDDGTAETASRGSEDRPDTKPMTAKAFKAAKTAELDNAVYPEGVGRVRRAPQMLSGIWSPGL